MDKKISVVIPCYNEEKTIAKVINNIPKEVFEIIIVDNNSTDKTAEIAKKLNAKVVKEKKQGYGYALQKGFQEAKGDIIVTLDGDGQYPAEKILELVEYLEKNNLDFLICSRFPLKNKNSLSPTRIIGNYFLTILTNLLFFTKIKDSQSGMMIFKKEILKKINLESGDMPLSEELKIKTILAGFKYGEINIDYYPREGESKLFPLKHGIKNTLFLIKLRIKTLPKKFILIFNLIFLLSIYSFLASFNINKPFINVTSDTNGENGLAVLNWLNIGILNLKFGKYVNGYLEKPINNLDIIRKDTYTHHPVFFLFPTYFLYKIFGVSEITTRGGSFFVFIIGIIFFYLALIKIFQNFFYPFLITFFLVILPGFIYYGTTFELAVFSLPLALISFSLFVFYYFSKRNLYLYSFLISMIIGGLMGWFYFFMPASIWLYLLLDKNKDFQNEKKKLLIIMPLVSILTFSLNLYHIYLLKGMGGFIDLKESFFYRSQKFPLSNWISVIYQRLKMQTNDLFLILSIIGLLLFFFFYFKKYKIFLPLLFMPILNSAVFYQWSTHPFGVIFFLPIIAITITLTLIYIFEQNKQIFLGALLFILIWGGYQSYKNLDFLVNKFLILDPRDIHLLKELQPQVKNNELCLGQNQMGLYYGGIVIWHLRKNILFSPTCLENENIKSAIIFHPQLGEFYQQEATNFINKKFQPIGCAGLWCLLVKQ